MASRSRADHRGPESAPTRRVVEADATYREETMTDTEMLNAIAKAKSARKAAHTRAQRTHLAATKAANSWFGATDVETAARSCAIGRADTARCEAIERADRKYREAVDAIIGQAGEWADDAARAAGAGWRR